MTKANTANIFLMLCAIMWGVTFTVIKAATQYIDASTFVAVRFVIASVIFAVMVRHQVKYTNRRLIKETLILGFFNSLVYISQTAGLVTESSANIAFLNALNVVIIPLLSPLFGLGKPSYLNIVCTVLSVTGIYVLTGANFQSFDMGDIWGIISALSFAITIMYLQKVTYKVRQYKLMAFYQAFFTLPLPVLLAYNTSLAHVFTPTVLIALFYCAIFSTVITFTWQTKYQRYTTASKAALIFMLEPVFAVIFAYIINGEPVFEHTIVGGIIILISVALSETKLLMLLKRKKV